MEPQTETNLEEPLAQKSNRRLSLILSDLIKPTTKKSKGLTVKIPNELEVYDPSNFNNDQYNNDLINLSKSTNESIANHNVDSNISSKQPKLIKKIDLLSITSMSYGEKEEKRNFKERIENVLSQPLERNKYKIIEKGFDNSWNGSSHNYTRPRYVSPPVSSLKLNTLNSTLGFSTSPLSINSNKERSFSPNSSHFKSWLNNNREWQQQKINKVSFQFIF